MTQPQLDESARKLLDTHLDSFEKLEIVRALRAAGRAMSREELGEECRFAHGTVREVVADLSRMSLIEVDEIGGLLRLGSSSHESAFQVLMTVYEYDRHVVLSALSEIAMKRIRNMAARAFANAFVLRKKRGDDDG